jgi:hypothetical protein
MDIFLALTALPLMPLKRASNAYSRVPVVYPNSRLQSNLLCNLLILFNFLFWDNELGICGSGLFGRYENEAMRGNVDRIEGWWIDRFEAEFYCGRL